jgi:hypothetical protein
MINTPTGQANEETGEFNLDDWVCPGEVHDVDEEPMTMDELFFWTAL